MGLNDIPSGEPITAILRTSEEYTLQVDSQGADRRHAAIAFAPVVWAVAFAALADMLDEPAPIALTHVTVVDGTGAQPAVDATLLIRDGRIEALGPASGVGIPDDAQVIDARGKFAIPGLWDMHVHLTMTTEIALPAFVANGVTGVRDMGGDLELVDALRDEIRRGDRLGPRIVRAGPTVDGYKEGLENRWVVATAEDGRNAVIELEKRKVDFLKVHNAVPREAYFALAQEATRRGARFSGHIPMTVTPAEAIEAGQNSIEHTETLIEGTLSGKQLALVLGLGGFVSDEAPRLFAKMAERGSAYTPVLIAYYESARRGEIESNPDPRAEYVAHSLREVWPEYFPTRRRVVEFLRRRMFGAFQALVAEMKAADVLILAGSDAGGRNVYPGFSLHDELGLLVEVGLTPTEALQAASLNAARHLGLEKTLGTVEVGKFADLVLLAADPLEDIANTRRIEAVITRGHYLPKDRLEAMLDAVREAAPNY